MKWCVCHRWRRKPVGGGAQLEVLKKGSAGLRVPAHTCCCRKTQSYCNNTTEQDGLSGRECRIVRTSALRAHAATPTHVGGVAKNDKVCAARVTQAVHCYANNRSTRAGLLVDKFCVLVFLRTRHLFGSVVCQAHRSDKMWCVTCTLCCFVEGDCVVCMNVDLGRECALVFARCAMMIHSDPEKCIIHVLGMCVMDLALRGRTLVAEVEVHSLWSLQGGARA